MKGFVRVKGFALWNHIIESYHRIICSNHYRTGYNKGVKDPEFLVSVGVVGLGLGSWGLSGLGLD